MKMDNTTNKDFQRFGIGILSSNWGVRWYSDEWMLFSPEMINNNLY